MFRAFDQWVYRQTYRAGDSNEILLIKKIWWVCLTFATPFTLTTAIIIYLMGHTSLSLLVLFTSFYWLVSMLIFRSIKKGIEWFGLSSQLFLLLETVVLVYLLGGMLESGGFIFYGLIGPVYAVVFPRKNIAFSLFIVYILIILGFLLIGRIENPVFILSYQQNLILFALNFALTAVFWFVAIYFFSIERDKALGKLALEEEKSHILLKNILPEEIADQLKDEPKSISERLEKVTIVFADMVDFTPKSEQLHPQELVKLLNEVFTYIDNLTEKYNLEKIKTIGDCYMVAAGIPNFSPGQAERCIALSMDILKFAKERELEFRIGIDSGSVVAGVIGFKKFSYDLWGSVVNTASRLQGQAPIGEIMISERTKKLIEHQYNCVDHGKISLKGIGEVKTWLVRGEKQNI